MIRVLALIAFVGFIVSVACFAGAAALGGRDIVENGWRIPADWHVDIDDRHDHDVDNDDDDGDDDGDTDRDTRTASREIAWDGASSLDVDVPAEVQFTQAAGAAKLTVSGPKSDVDHVIVRDGRVTFDEPMHHRHRLLIVMTAPNVSRFTLNGEDKLSITGFRQDRLAIDISGAAQAEAQGEAKSFDLQISGSGGADLSRLTSDGGKVDIAGSGRATIAPKTSADVAISGSGEVNLLSRPQDLHSSVSGSGRLIQNGAPA
jgi:hypothetical protein